MAWPKGVPRKPQQEGETMTEDIAVTAEIEAPGVLPAPSTVLTPELTALLAAMQAQTMAAVAEMRKPSAEEQAKIDEAASRRVAIARSAAYAAKVEEEQRSTLQASCSHSKPNGATAFVAQVNSNGCYRAFCPYCHYTSPNIRVEDWQKTEGLNFHKMKNVTIAQLEALAARSAEPTPPRAVPFGFTPEAL